FLHFAIGLNFLKTTKHADSMINMRNKITRLQFPQHPERKRLVFVISLFDLVFMIPLKDLVIGIANQLQIFINKSFVNGFRNRVKYNSRIQIVENSLQSFELSWVFSKEV